MSSWQFFDDNDEQKSHFDFVSFSFFFFVVPSLLYFLFSYMKIYSDFVDSFYSCSRSFEIRKVMSLSFGFGLARRVWLLTCYQRSRDAGLVIAVTELLLL